MKTEMWPLERIKPYAQNPRVNDHAVDAVAESLRQFGVRQPIVVDEAGVIVCGHTRWKAALKLGFAQIPVHVAQDLTPEQIRAYRIADNKTAELADWDLKLLPLELAELQSAGIDWTLLGFDADELLKLHVLDLFGGSGSTLIAAEQTERRAFLVELDPPYCDVIVQRWEKFTGQKAERLAT